MSESQRNNRSLVEELVVLGTYDWVRPADVLSLTEDFEADNYPLRRTMSFGAIAEVVVAGLMIPGSVPDRTFVPWDTSEGDSIAAIVRQWLSEWGKDFPNLDFDICLKNTADGTELALSVITREDAESEQPS